MGRLLLNELIYSSHAARPLIIQQDLLDPSAFEVLLARASAEIEAPDLCGWGLFVSAYGRKPRTEDRATSWSLTLG